jgi:2-iminobutanoate/2-iminopropanoate deaminase
VVSCQQAPFKLTSVLLICNLYWQLATGNWQLVLPMREVVSTKDAPQAIGPYSQAIKANGFVFVSGQVAIDLSTQQVVTGDVAAQTDRVLRNLSAILEAAGSGFGKVVRSTVFLKNMNDFAAMNQVYGKYFSSAPPARSTVEVARLPKDVLVEIDVIALA